MAKRPSRWVLAYDLHYPAHDPASWGCVLDYVRRNRVDGFIFGGDQLDLSCISHHNVSKPLYRPKGALRSNLNGFKRDVLDPIDDVLGSKADKRFLIGNHEAWLTEQLAETNPELDGMLDLAERLDLDDRGWKVIPQGGYTNVGKLVVIHGDTVGGGVNAAKKAAEVYAGSSVVLGHHHTLQSFTRSSPVAQTDRWTGTVLPCLSTTAPTYGRNRANAWLNGFGVVEVQPDQTFNLYPVVITEGRCSFAGEVYSDRRYRKR